MRRLYFATNGRFNELFSLGQNILHVGGHTTLAQGPVHTALDEYGAKRVVQSLARDGYCLLEGAVPEKLCSDLMKFALETPCTPRTTSAAAKILFDKRAPKSNIYDFDRDSLLHNRAVQALVTDGSLFEIGKRYIGRSALIHGIAMWWSTGQFADPDLSLAAQLFHIDNDTIRWLNVFFYLTDVDERNGPHMYVAASHKRKPTRVLRDGRIPDEDVFACYPRERVREFKAPAGSILFEDTRGLHKGKPLQKGERLMFQIVYATTAFGQNYPRVELDATYDPGFADVVRRNRYVYGRLFDL
jgi:hypothetical protein